MVEARMPEVADKLTLARIAAAKYWQTGDDFDEHAARSILSGAWDDQAYVQASLAGIDAGLEMAAKACEAQRDVFGSDQYATGQPASSFGERFACGRCAEEIRGLALAGRGEGE